MCQAISLVVSPPGLMPAEQKLVASASTPIALSWRTTDHATIYANMDMVTQLSSARQSVAGTPAAGLPLCAGEYNLSGNNSAWDPPESQTIVGAVYNALNLYRCIEQNLNVRWGADWDVFGDSHYGIINDPAQNAARNYDIYPAGWLLGYAGQHMDGTRVTTTLNITGKIAQYAIVSGSNFAIQIINYDTATAFNGFQVAVQAATSISSSVTLWQLTLPLMIRSSRCRPTRR